MAAIGTSLEKVYCGRMVWIKIVNMPGGSFLSKAINSAIPAEKKDKISFPRDIEDVAAHFEPNQLEKRYGGAASNLEPEETYPFHFFPHPRGEVAVHESTCVSDFSHKAAQLLRGTSSLRDTEDFSLHESTHRVFHEGQLWDDSSEAARQRWLPGALAGTSLSPAAAEALKGMTGGASVEPCRDVDRWLELLNPAAIRHQKNERDDASNLSDVNSTWSI
eukprot:CAMPEP_0179144916 /NCGR_PEP_ID=MMETSP0796-20121207/69872_1 /TAXON_ID=73915 /ORGANISM="Pyrodinium bahamense, Strain pbaha01" /LENGTH=218 /DNA_ID=CAMNT_0020845233 /DNA_START=10 /DNA_END=666 /DNA_ORIENTATION=-